MLDRSFKIIKNNPRLLIDIIIVATFLLLPYLIFGGKLFIGGDDTRLFYVFPVEWLNTYGLSSWMHFSSGGSENPNQFILPFVAVISVLNLIVGSQIIVSYLCFSLPMILGFVYFKKMIREFFDDQNYDYNFEITLSALFYVTSPILITGIYTNYLYAVWLVALVPIIQYYLIVFLKNNEFKNLYLASIWSVILAPALFSIPWLLGYLIPVFVACLCCFPLFFRNNLSASLFKRVAVFFGVIVLVSMFWLVPFAAPFINQHGDGFSGGVMSKQTKDTFEPTVMATAKGTVIYPLLNLFHRKIAFDFNWSLKGIFLSYYDKTIYLNLIFLFLVLVGITNYRKYLSINEKKFYLIIILSFLISLFLFTINIGVLKQLLIWLGNIPGFVMFRNVYDKFAFGYILIYATLIAFSLIIFNRKYRQNRYVYYCVEIIFLCSVIINFYPIGKSLNRPLWTTKDVPTSVNIPTEYLNFIGGMKDSVVDGGNIFSVPYGIASYSIFRGVDGVGVFAGRSPVELLSGVNDYSGRYSFRPMTADLVDKFILNRDYVKLKNLFGTYNINSILETRNLPTEVMGSYLFDRSILGKLDAEFKSFFYGRLWSRSSGGNYELYSINNSKDLPVINIPHNYYYYSGDNISDIQDSIYNLINGDNLLIENYKENTGIKILNSVEQIEPGKDNRVSDEFYKIYSNYKLFALDYSRESAKLSILTGGLGDKVDIFSVYGDDTDYRIKIGSRYYKMLDARNILIDVNDKISIYKVNTVIEIQVDDILGTWGHGDCFAYNREPAVFFEGGDVLKLSAINGHNACVYKKIGLSKDVVYEYSFDYISSAKKLETYFRLSDKLIFNDNIIPTSSDWDNYSKFFEGGDSDSALFHIYSGRDATQAVTQYKNIKLKSYSPITEISPLNFIDIRQNLYKAVVFDKGQKMEILSSGDLLYRYEDNSGWSEGDCMALNTSKSVFFKYQKGTAELSSIGGHNACLYREFEIDKNKIYNLSFNYNLRGNSNYKLYISFGKNIKPVIYEEKSVEGEWKKMSLNIEIPSTTEKMTVYLYSGESKRGQVSTIFKNIKIESFSRGDYRNLLVGDKKIDLERPKRIESEKINNTRYRVKIYGATDSFFINFFDAYSDGWKVYPGRNNFCWYSNLFKKPADLNHYKANLYSNAWYIDPSTLCGDERGCTLNGDGSYDMEMVIEFWPQRWFYLGLLISVTTMMSCLIYLRHEKNS